ncbi:hypothetical protein PR202_ga02184 [Eleusine coracana subsp. coracana]|uniref:Uncharacterized protein n=1 Tax=Eleusine coracana subsp. coracana TaxID=191504 RepID=A0AAV5BL16_ELECO|nr:hypothetical protein PR202_ga02184 [Eleusine coracana subsp. coracana]
MSSSPSLHSRARRDQQNFAGRLQASKTQALSSTSNRKLLRHCQNGWMPGSYAILAAFRSTQRKAKAQGAESRLISPRTLVGWGFAGGEEEGMGNRNEGAASPVVLNVYDLTPANDYFYWLGFGVFHSGIEGSVFDCLLPESVQVSPVGRVPTRQHQISDDELNSISSSIMEDSDDEAEDKHLLPAPSSDLHSVDVPPKLAKDLL